MTISVCMIVKNEERILKRCLDCLKDIADEFIIVDTGSTDDTKKIAMEYTEKIYDFSWEDDFSAARNFACAKATCDYIYSADADEVIDEENRKRFLLLKQTLLPEIEIVQMKYGNQLSHGTIYNYDEEYRPKLFKRLRKFNWMDPIHETLSITPVIYDSEVVITHLPEKNHAGRDIRSFEKQVKKGICLSTRLHNLYAKELFISGEKEDFVRAQEFFENSVKDCNRNKDEILEASCVAARSYFLEKKYEDFFKYALKATACGGCSEICEMLGEYFSEKKDYDEAIVWFYNAAFETEPVLNIKMGKELPRKGLAACYRELGNKEEAEKYERMEK